MVDRVDRITRHKIMSANRSMDTSPEKEVRNALFKQGLRFRINVESLPGKPDIVLSRHRTAIFVHGCFWHGHECNRMPKAKSNTRFWRQKIRHNQERDRRTIAKLMKGGWRVIVLWECALRRQKTEFAKSPKADWLRRWIIGKRKFVDISESGVSTFYQVPLPR